MSAVAQDAPRTEGTSVAPLHWAIAVLSVAGLVALWVWLISFPPFSLPPQAATRAAFLVAAPATVWGLLVLVNHHRPLLALLGSATPMLMAGLVIAALLDSAPPDPELLTADERWIAGAMVLASAPVLALLACSFRKGLRQARERRAALWERREAEKRAREAEEARGRQAEADRRARRKRRGELIEEATVRMAERVVGGQGPAGPAGSADDLAALALFQDIDRREALEGEEVQRRRAEGAEEELAEARERVRKLKRQLLEQEVSRMTVGLVADVADRTLTGATLGGLYAGSRVGRAFDRIRGE